MSGDLPCSKEEAVTLAGIQLHIQKAWPDEDDFEDLGDDDDISASRHRTDDEDDVSV